MDHSYKPTVSLALEQVVGKLGFNDDLGIHAIKRYIVSTLHAMIMIQDMVSTLRAMNLLSDILQLHNKDVRLLRLSLNQHTVVAPQPHSCTDLPIVERRSRI